MTELFLHGANVVVVSKWAKKEYQSGPSRVVKTKSNRPSHISWENVQEGVTAQLADGSFIEVAIHSATIVWKGLEVEATVLTTGEHPLLGTTLLDGSELLAQFREEGLVTVDDL